MRKDAKNESYNLGQKEVGTYYCAICDDEKFTCSQIESIVIEYAEANKINIDIDVFYSGEGLAETLRNGMSYDVIFLDIDLLTSSGIDIGKLIRYELDNEVSQIIYISSSKQYAMQLFQTRPTDFILKPFTENEITRVLIQALKIIERGSAMFEFKVGRGYYKIPCNKIMYFQSGGRKITIIMEGEEIEFYGKLDQIYKLVPSTDYIQIHKSYLINCNYVYRYSFETVTMKNGDILSISQSKRKLVREKILLRRRTEID